MAAEEIRELVYTGAITGRKMLLTYTVSRILTWTNLCYRK